MHDDELGCHRLAAGGGFGRPARYFVHYIYSEDLHQRRHGHTHRQGLIHTHHTQRPTHCLNLLEHTHTHTETHIHTDIDTHTETHTLPQHTEHLTDNSHSDFLRDEKCFRATRRLVFGGPENFKKILKNNTVRFKFLSFLIFSEPPKI